MTINRLHERGLNPTATVGVGFVDNWQLKFNKRSFKDPEIGFANIEPFWGGRVYGVIFGLREADLEKLDGFEGYPNHYQRTNLHVKWALGDSWYDCVTYIANRKWTTGKKLMVTEEYRSYIDAGMRENLSKVPFTNTYMDSVYSLMKNDDELV